MKSTKRKTDMVRDLAEIILREEERAIENYLLAWDACERGYDDGSLYRARTSLFRVWELARAAGLLHLVPRTCFAEAWERIRLAIAVPDAASEDSIRWAPIIAAEGSL